MLSHFSDKGRSPASLVTVVTVVTDEVRLNELFVLTPNGEKANCKFVRVEGMRGFRVHQGQL
jgi:hypothetical protein